MNEEPSLAIERKSSNTPVVADGDRLALIARGRKDATVIAVEAAEAAALLSEAQRRCKQEGHSEEVLKIYEEAADRGGQEARGYLDGYFGECCCIDCFKYWEKRAKRGDLIGQRCLGLMYLFGDVIQDNLKALKWLGRAAKQGDAEAQVQLSCLYEEGKAVQKDSAMTVHWLRKAAEQGNVDPQQSLARLYEQGTCGVPADSGEAEKWATAARSQPYQRAPVIELMQALQKSLDGSKKKMSGSDNSNSLP